MNREGWKQYVDCFHDEFKKCDFKAELISACKGHEDIARVVYYHCLDHSINWLYTPVPALDNKIPSEEIEKGNDDSVRKLLWRFPCETF